MAHKTRKGDYKMVSEKTTWFKSKVKKIKGYVTKEMKEQLKYEMSQEKRVAYRKSKRTKKSCK